VRSSLGGIGARVYDMAIVEIGYWVKAGARARGVATRALELVARFAFDELGAARVQLTTDPDNIGSQRVAEKAGFTRERGSSLVLDFKGRRRDAVMFSLLPADLAEDYP
jgi:RimJ/RimL family protein N-acetyltransferase